jgi:O-antigen ligase
MSATLPCSAGLSRPRLWPSWVWFVAGAGSTLLLLLFPMAAPVVLVSSTAVLLGWRLVMYRRLPLPMPSAVIVTLVLVDIYLIINSSWSLSPADAMRSVGLLLIITGILYLTLNALDGSDADLLRPIAAGLVLGVVLAGAVLCFEAFTRQSIQRLLMAYMPALAPNPHHMNVRADGSVGLHAYLMNRSISVFTVLFWPAVLLVDRLGLSLRQRIWLLIALAPGVAGVLRSVHGTSKMAFIGAALVFGFYQLYPLLVTRLTRVGWVAAVLLVVPTVTLAFGAQLYLASWLPQSAQHRVVIWGYTAEQLARAPLLGTGVATARALNTPDSTDKPHAPGTKFQLSAGSHSHNAYLQVWYETGAVGALLLLALGLLVLRAIAAAPVSTQGHLYATFAACALLAASAFSIWAPWMLASFGIVIVCAAIAVTLPATTRAS